MKQDIAKSRVKYGGSEIQRDFPSDITQKKEISFVSWNIATKFLEIADLYLHIRYELIMISVKCVEVWWVNSVLHYCI